MLWRRAEAGPPASMTFPGAREESWAPEGQASGRTGQAPAQRHVSRASALLDNVAPAAAVLPLRLPARQHADGVKLQPATSSGSSGDVREPPSAPAPLPGKLIPVLCKTTFGLLWLCHDGWLL